MVVWKCLIQGVKGMHITGKCIKLLVKGLVQQIYNALWMENPHCECELYYNVAQSLKRYKRSCYSAIAIAEEQDVNQEARTALNYM